VHDLLNALAAAWQLILLGDSTLVAIVSLSLSISLTAVVLASVLGLPLGAALAVMRFPGQNALIVVVNALMGLPPVVAGLFVYLLLSRSGPLVPSRRPVSRSPKPRPTTIRWDRISSR
jgi:tungstate transport system permease protein